MVNDSIAKINKSSQATERHQCPTESNVKSKKRQNKKSRVKNDFYADEFEPIFDKTLRRRNKSSEQHKINKEIAPVKVKSASWKRSEKSTTPLNNLANKKHKKSSNWLRFSNSKIKKSDTERHYNRNESSACRPGTTYSDVLFGAGCSNLVKIKNCITPRFYSSQSTNTNQKKLTKSLFKFNASPDKKHSEDSEAEEKKALFPALQTIKNKLFTASSKIGCNNSKGNTENSSLSSSPNRIKEHESFTLPDMDNLSLNENKTAYGSSLEHHLQHVEDFKDSDATCSNGYKYLFDSITKIPKWNFTCIETGISDGFPKFLYQFEDENYLKAEKMSLLGLKLALGNCRPYNK